MYALKIEFGLVMDCVLLCKILLDIGLNLYLGVLG